MPIYSPMNYLNFSWKPFKVILLLIVLISIYIVANNYIFLKLQVQWSTIGTNLFIYQARESLAWSQQGF